MPSSWHPGSCKRLLPCLSHHTHSARRRGRLTLTGKCLLCAGLVTVLPPELRELSVCVPTSPRSKQRSKGNAWLQVKPSPSDFPGSAASQGSSSLNPSPHHALQHTPGYHPGSDAQMWTRGVSVTDLEKSCLPEAPALPVYSLPRPQNPGGEKPEHSTTSGQV